MIDNRGTATKPQAAESEAGENIARNETLLFLNRRDCEQVGLSIFRNDFALLIDKNLRIVNQRAVPFRHAADDRNRKLSGDLLKSRNESATPRSGVRLDRRR